MGKSSTLDTIKGLLVFFVNENAIGTANNIAMMTGRDRIAIKKYLDFFCDLMMLKKYVYGKTTLYTINVKYKDLFKDSNIVQEMLDEMASQRSVD